MRILPYSCFVAAVFVLVFIETGPVQATDNVVTGLKTKSVRVFSDRDGKELLTRIKREDLAAAMKKGAVPILAGPSPRKLLQIRLEFEDRSRGKIEGWVKQSRVKTTIDKSVKTSGCGTLADSNRSQARAGRGLGEGC